LFLGVRIDFSKKIEYFVIYNKKICIIRKVTGVQILLGISCNTSINIIHASLFILIVIGINNKFYKYISNLNIYSLVNIIK
jgi:hypothetical protein